MLEEDEKMGKKQLAKLYFDKRMNYYVINKTKD